MPIANQTFGSQTTDMTEPVGLMTPTKDAPVVNQRSAARAGNYTIRPVGMMTPAAGPTSNPAATVAGQMTDLLNSDSPYMQAARDYSNQVMNARGLTQSSIAVGAAQEAAIRAGLPIAQQDASQKFTADNTYDLHRYDMRKLDATTAAQSRLSAQEARQTATNQSRLSAQEAQQTATNQSRLSAQEARQALTHTAAVTASDRQKDYITYGAAANDRYAAEYSAIQQSTMAPEQKEAAKIELKAWKEANDLWLNATYGQFTSASIDAAPFVSGSSTPGAKTPGSAPPGTAAPGSFYDTSSLTGAGQAAGTLTQQRDFLFNKGIAPTAINAAADAGLPLVRDDGSFIAAVAPGSQKVDSETGRTRTIAPTYIYYSPTTGTYKDKNGTQLTATRDGSGQIKISGARVSGIFRSAAYTGPTPWLAQ